MIKSDKITEQEWTDFVYANRSRKRIRGFAGLAVAICALVLGVLLFFLINGCTTFKPDPGLVQLVAQDAAFIGTGTVLAVKPALRPEFEKARDALQGFVDAGTGNAADLQQILTQRLPVPSLGTNSTLTVGQGGVVLYNATGAVVAKIDKNAVVSTYAQPIAQGLLAGIKQGLGQ